MADAHEESNLDQTIERVVEVSVYFRSPLSLDEIALYFLPRYNVDGAQLHKRILTSSRLSGELEIHNGYVVPCGSTHLVKERIERIADSKIKIAASKSLLQLLRRVAPFVKTGAITGSAAYGASDGSEDVDFFLITLNRRLWITVLLSFLTIRTHNVLFPSPKRVPFCLSYVHTENGFSHESRTKRNALFARELLMAKPILGSSSYGRILRENDWITGLYPLAYSTAISAVPAGATNDPEKRSGLSIFLDLVDAAAFVVVGNYLRLRSWAKNRKFMKEGKLDRLFAPTITRDSCVYTSNVYRWLHSIWGSL